MTAIIKIDRNGRILIPKKFRDALNLRPGIKLTIEQIGDQLVLQAVIPSRSEPKQRFPVIKSSNPGSLNLTNEQVDDLMFLS